MVVSEPAFTVAKPAMVNSIASEIAVHGPMPSGSSVVIVNVTLSQLKGTSEVAQATNEFAAEKYAEIEKEFKDHVD